MNTLEKIKKSSSVFLISFFDVPFFIGFNQVISPLFILARPILFISITAFIGFIFYSFDLAFYDLVSISGLVVASLFSRSLAFSNFFSDRIIALSFRFLLFMILLDYFLDFSFLRDIFNIQRDVTAARVSVISSEPSFLTYTFFGLAFLNFILSRKVFILIFWVFVVYFVTVSQALVLYTLFFLTLYIVVYSILSIFKNKIFRPTASFIGLYIVIISSYLFISSDLYYAIALYEINEQGSWRGISNYWALDYSSLVNTQIDIGRVVSEASYEGGIPWITRPWSLLPALIAIFGLLPAIFFLIFVFRKCFAKNIKLNAYNTHFLTSAYAIIPIVLFLGPKWHFLGLVAFFYSLRKLKD